MSLPQLSRLMLAACVGAASAGAAFAQTAAGGSSAAPAGAAGANASPAEAGKQPIAWVPTEGVSIAGSLAVADGRAAIANNGTVTAGERTAHISLARGGQIALCATTKVHLTRDSSLGKGETGALMLSLDRGALEANYTTGQYSDVVMTPDLRILVSGPGEADLKLRIGANGDTCVDNHGANAPYITVSSQFEDGLYRVQPNQRVSFQHGSLHDVVDNEAEPCGCPATAPASVAAAGTTSDHPAKPGQPVGGPSSTPEDTAFPLAQSEGLAPSPPPPTKPVVPAGQAHAEVTVPLVYNGGTPPPAPPAPDTQPAPSSTAPAIAAAPPPQKQSSPGFFHKVGHFFARLVGKG